MAWIRVGDLLVADDASTAAIVNNTSSLTRAALDTLYLQPTIPDASISTRGLIELATTGEATAGTDTIRAVTPAGLSAAITAATKRQVTSEVSVSLSGQVGGSTTVSWPVGTFSTFPNVQVQLATATAATLNTYVANRTETGCTVGIYNTIGNPLTGSFALSVLATQR